MNQKWETPVLQELDVKETAGGPGFIVDDGNFGFDS